MTTQRRSNSLQNELVKITPTMAKRWLANNHSNRNIQERIVLQYALDMEKGDWKVTGDVIRIARNGDLLDGQHRLEACVLAGVPFYSYVLENCDPEIVTVIDTGRKRTMADLLKMRGEVNSNNLAAAVNWLIRYEDSETFRSNRAVSHRQSLDYLEKHPHIRESVAFAAGGNRTRLFPVSLIASVHYLGSQGDRTIADRFWKLVNTGVNLQERSPIYVLRRWAERNLYDQRKASPIVVAAIVIKAWNAYVEGREISGLSWRPAGGEEFPQMIIPEPPNETETETTD